MLLASLLLCLTRPCLPSEPAPPRRATCRNEDGSICLVTISPGVNGIEFLVVDTDANRSLTLRDARHAYVFEETRAATSDQNR